MLALLDVLVDGRYIHAKRNLMLKFRGSENQRLIDMNKTRERGEVVLWNE
jgi:anaerobic ribonucleoside-triphosphate reductase activating protein